MSTSVPAAIQLAVAFPPPLLVALPTNLGFGHVWTPRLILDHGNYTIWLAIKRLLRSGGTSPVAGEVLAGMETPVITAFSSMTAR